MDEYILGYVWLELSCAKLCESYIFFNFTNTLHWKEQKSNYSHTCILPSAFNIFCYNSEVKS